MEYEKLCESKYMIILHVHVYISEWVNQNKKTNH